MRLGAREVWARHKPIALHRGGDEAAPKDGFDPLTSLGPSMAERDDSVLRGDEAKKVSFLADLADLADLAGDDPALELAIGTGRIALPLAATGIPHRRRGARARGGRLAGLAGPPPKPRPEYVGADRVVLDVCRHDPVTQILRLAWRAVHGWQRAARDGVQA